VGEVSPPAFPDQLPSVLLPSLPTDILNYQLLPASTAVVSFTWTTKFSGLTTVLVSESLPPAIAASILFLYVIISSAKVGKIT
jgi:hypothetical protein